MSRGGQQVKPPRNAPEKVLWKSPRHVDAQVTVLVEGDVSGMLALGVVDVLPPDWTFLRTGQGAVPDNVKECEAGRIEFLWYDTPDLPVRFTYYVQAPGVRGTERITRQAEWRVGNDSFCTEPVEITMNAGS